MRTSDGLTVDWLRLAAGLPTPQPPTPGGPGGLTLALGRGFAEVVGGHGAGTATYWAARLRVRGVRPARCAHDGPRCYDAGRASQLGAYCKVLLFGLLPKPGFKVDQQDSTRCAASFRRLPPAVVRVAHGPSTGGEGWRGSQTRHRPQQTRRTSKNSCPMQRKLPLPLWGRGLGGGAAHRQALTFQSESRDRPESHDGQFVQWAQAQDFADVVGGDLFVAADVFFGGEGVAGGEVFHAEGEQAALWGFGA